MQRAKLATPHLEEDDNGRKKKEESMMKKTRRNLISSRSIFRLATLVNRDKLKYPSSQPSTMV